MYIGTLSIRIPVELLHILYLYFLPFAVIVFIGLQWEKYVSSTKSILESLNLLDFSDTEL
jgi:hypothetical protein